MPTELNLVPSYEVRVSTAEKVGSWPAGGLKHLAITTRTEGSQRKVKMVPS